MAVLPQLPGRDELLLALDGGAGSISGCFAHEAIDYALRGRVAAWHEPWRLCVRVVDHQGVRRVRP